jgi:glutathione S-transferase
MTDIKPLSLVLFHTPGACSRVTMNALEEIGLPFEDRPIDIFKGAQRRPDFLAINPKGKVPALLVDGVPLTETPAILAWLTAEYPDANLMPAGDTLARAQAFADIVWCSNTLHPLARAIRMPQRMTLGDPEPARAAAIEQITPMLVVMQGRFEAQPWWFGQEWSILDVYIAWIAGMCVGAGVDFSAYGALLAHMARVRGRPSFQRALAREQHALDSAGIVLPGGKL